MKILIHFRKDNFAYYDSLVIPFDRSVSVEEVIKMLEIDLPVYSAPKEFKPKGICMQQCEYLQELYSVITYEVRYDVFNILKMRLMDNMIEFYSGTILQNSQEGKLLVSYPFYDDCNKVNILENVISTVSNSISI